MHAVNFTECAEFNEKSKLNNEATQAIQLFEVDENYIEESIEILKNCKYPRVRKLLERKKIVNYHKDRFDIASGHSIEKLMASKNRIKEKVSQLKKDLKLIKYNLKSIPRDAFNRIPTKSKAKKYTYFTIAINALLVVAIVFFTASSYGNLEKLAKDSFESALSIMAVASAAFALPTLLKVFDSLLKTYAPTMRGVFLTILFIIGLASFGSWGYVTYKFFAAEAASTLSLFGESGATSTSNDINILGNTFSITDIQVACTVIQVLWEAITSLFLAIALGAIIDSHKTDYLVESVENLAYKTYQNRLEAVDEKIHKLKSNLLQVNQLIKNVKKVKSRVLKDVVIFFDNLFEETFITSNGEEITIKEKPISPKVKQQLEEEKLQRKEYEKTLLEMTNKIDKNNDFEKICDEDILNFESISRQINYGR